MRKNYPLQYGKAVWKEIEKASHSGYSRIFDDWLDLILNSILALTDNMVRPGIYEKLENNNLDGKYEVRYMEIVSKYGKGKKGARPIDHFMNAWALLVQETIKEQRDILGEIFQAKITSGEHGQFFTPDNITECMTKMLDIGGEKVYDPCCGSGRFLIQSGLRCKDAMLYGTDLDIRCAKITVINMFIFDFNSTIYCGNSLSTKMFKRWVTGKGGYVYEFDVKNIEAAPKLNPIQPALSTFYI